ncbi:unnamed protein product [Rotaria sp. Silwood2]|nr:unnamed protein product [Rotaria sp. Silwood2]CAF2466439.1 unnamed protein product [Rotaria sp. Silwood2]CAF4615834.1 unnamed protein product [Rotaria sp. Silwood2]
MTIIVKHNYIFSSFLTGTTNPANPSGTTNPTNTPASLATWKIALIAVGSFLGILLLGGTIGLILWKWNSKRKFQAKSSLEFRSPFNEQIIRESIPQYTITDLRQVSSSPSSHRTKKQSSSYHDTFRPTIPQITSTSYDFSNGQEVRRNQQRVQSSNYEQYSYPSISQPISISHHVNHQHQIPRDRRTPLSPLEND